MQLLLSDMKRGCYVELYRSFLPPAAASSLFLEAVRSPFEHESFVMYGKQITTRRKTCGFGDPGIQYHYAGIDRPAQPWPEYMLPLKTKVEHQVTKSANRAVAYNYALATMYVDGGAGLGFHADNEPEIDQQIPICSISLGAARDFTMRDTATKTHVLKVSLNSGDLLIMRGATQLYYQHALPERSTRGNTRVSYTFRAIKAQTNTCSH